LPPQNDDWLYHRAASIAYQLYMKRASVGVKYLRWHYGTKHRRGTKTEKCRMAAGKNIRYCLNQLKAIGLVGGVNLQTEEGQVYVLGKALTKKGVTDMDRIAAAMHKKK